MRPRSEHLLHPSRTATPPGCFQQLQGQLVQPEGSLQQPQGHFQQPPGHLHQAMPASPPHRWLRAALDSAARLSHQAEQPMHKGAGQPTTDTWLQAGRFPQQSVPQESVSPTQQQQGTVQQGIGQHGTGQQGTGRQQGSGQQGTGQQGPLQQQQGVMQQQAPVTGAATSFLSADPSLACLVPDQPPYTAAAATVAGKHQPQHDVCTQPGSSVMQTPAAWAQSSGHDFQLQPHQQQHKQNGCFGVHQQLHWQLQQQRVSDPDRQLPQQQTPAATWLHEQVLTGNAESCL